MVFDYSLLEAVAKEKLPNEIKCQLSIARRAKANMETSVNEAFQFLFGKINDLEDVLADNPELQEKFEAEVLKYAKMAVKVEKYSKALDELERGCNGQKLPEDIGSFLRQKSELVESDALERKIKGHDFYKFYCEHSGKSFEPDVGDDEDLVIQQGEVSTMCPITQMKLVDPVKSLDCPHVYSKAAIQDMIRRNKRTAGCPCPVAGCNKTVKANRLEKDTMMEMRLNMTPASQATGGSASQHSQNRRSNVVEDSSDEEYVA